jgi:hypothetical protein
VRRAATGVSAGVPWRNHRPFWLAPAGALLPTCPVLSENLSPPSPGSLKRCPATLGRFLSGRRSMIVPPGLSATIGSIARYARCSRFCCELAVHDRR